MVVLLLIVTTIASVFWRQPTNAASLVLDGSSLLEGDVSYTTIDQDATGSISLQSGDLGKWYGYDGMQNLPSRNIYYDSDIVYGPNNSLYLIGCLNTRSNFISWF